MQHPSYDYDPQKASSAAPRRPVQDGMSQVRPPVGYGYRRQDTHGTQALGEDFSRGVRAAQGAPVPQSSVPYPPQGSASYVPQGSAPVPPQPTVPYPPQRPASYVPQGSAPVPPQPSVPYPPQGSASYVPQSSVPCQPVGQASASYVPAPEPEDPFGEPGADRRLKKQRSHRVYIHLNGFWRRPVEKRSVPKQAGKSSYAGNHVLRRVLISLGVIALVAFVLYGMVFRVSTVQVLGNNRVSAEEVIRASGVQIGESITRVDASEVAKGIASNRYLIFKGVECVMPNTVVIRVKERTPAAVLNYCGVNYTIDHKGMVLEESETDVLVGVLPQLSGMDIAGQYGCDVGRVISVNNTAQLSAMQELLVELEVLSAQQEISRIKLSDMTHILLETSEGYSVSLGNATNIHAKLKAMLSIRRKLNEMGKGSGTIDVSNPEAPTFLPETE